MQVGEGVPEGRMRAGGRGRGVGWTCRAEGGWAEPVTFSELLQPRGVGKELDSVALAGSAEAFGVPGLERGALLDQCSLPSLPGASTSMMRAGVASEFHMAPEARRRGLSAHAPGPGAVRRAGTGPAGPRGAENVAEVGAALRGEGALTEYLDGEAAGLRAVSGADVAEALGGLRRPPARPRSRGSSPASSPAPSVPP